MFYLRFERFMRSREASWAWWEGGTPWYIPTLPPWVYTLYHPMYTLYHPGYTTIPGSMDVSAASLLTAKRCRMLEPWAQ